MSNENISDRAGKGGALHQLSDKFYEGGQFMPAPDVLAGAKRKAAQKASGFNYNAVSVQGIAGKFAVVLAIVVRFVPSEYEPKTVTRSKCIASFSNEEEAKQIAAAIPQFGRAA